MVEAADKVAPLLSPCSSSSSSPTVGGGGRRPTYQRHHHSRCWRAPVLLIAGVMALSVVLFSFLQQDTAPTTVQQQQQQLHEHIGNHHHHDQEGRDVVLSPLLSALPPLSLSSSLRRGSELETAAPSPNRHRSGALPPAARGRDDNSALSSHPHQPEGGSNALHVPQNDNDSLSSPNTPLDGGDGQKRTKEGAEGNEIGRRPAAYREQRIRSSAASDAADENHHHNNGNSNASRQEQHQEEGTTIITESSSSSSSVRRHPRSEGTAAGDGGRDGGSDGDGGGGGGGSVWADDEDHFVKVIDCYKTGLRGGENYYYDGVVAGGCVPLPRALTTEGAADHEPHERGRGGEGSTASTRYEAPADPTVVAMVDTVDALLLSATSPAPTTAAADNNSGGGALVLGARTKRAPSIHTRWLFPEWRLWGGEIGCEGAGGVDEEEEGGGENEAHHRLREPVAGSSSSSQGASSFSPLSDFTTIGQHNLSAPNNLYQMRYFCIDEGEGTVIAFEEESDANVRESTDGGAEAEGQSQREGAYQPPPPRTKRRKRASSSSSVAMPTGRSEHGFRAQFYANQRMFHANNIDVVPLRSADTDAGTDGNGGGASSPSSSSTSRWRAVVKASLEAAGPQRAAPPPTDILFLDDGPVLINPIQTIEMRNPAHVFHRVATAAFQLSDSDVFPNGGHPYQLYTMALPATSPAPFVSRVFATSLFVHHLDEEGSGGSNAEEGRQGIISEGDAARSRGPFSRGGKFAPQREGIPRIPLAISHVLALPLYLRTVEEMDTVTRYLGDLPLPSSSSSSSSHQHESASSQHADNDVNATMRLLMGRRHTLASVEEALLLASASSHSHSDNPPSGGDHGGRDEVGAATTLSTHFLSSDRIAALLASLSPTPVTTLPAELYTPQLIGPPTPHYDGEEPDARARRMLRSAPKDLYSPVSMAVMEVMDTLPKEAFGMAAMYGPLMSSSPPPPAFSSSSSRVGDDHYDHGSDDGSGGGCEAFRCGGDVPAVAAARIAKATGTFHSGSSSSSDGVKGTDGGETRGDGDGHHQQQRSSALRRYCAAHKRCARPHAELLVTLRGYQDCSRWANVTAAQSARNDASSSSSSSSSSKHDSDAENIFERYNRSIARLVSSRAQQEHRSSAAMVGDGGRPLDLAPSPSFSSSFPIFYAHDTNNYSRPVWHNAVRALLREAKRYKRDAYHLQLEQQHQQQPSAASSSFGTASATAPSAELLSFITPQSSSGSASATSAATTPSSSSFVYGYILEWRQRSLIRYILAASISGSKIDNTRTTSNTSSSSVFDYRVAPPPKGRFIVGDYFRELFAVLLERGHAMELEEEKAREKEEREADRRGMEQSSSSSSPSSRDRPRRRRRRQLICIKHATVMHVNHGGYREGDARLSGLPVLEAPTCAMRAVLNATYRATHQRYAPCAARMRMEAPAAAGDNGRRSGSGPAAQEEQGGNAGEPQRKKAHEQHADKRRAGRGLGFEFAHPLFALPLEEQQSLRRLFAASQAAVETVLNGPMADRLLRALALAARSSDNATAMFDADTDHGGGGGGIGASRESTESSHSRDEYAYDGSDGAYTAAPHDQVLSRAMTAFLRAAATRSGASSSANDGGGGDANVGDDGPSASASTADGLSGEAMLAAVIRAIEVAQRSFDDVLMSYFSRREGEGVATSSAATDVPVKGASKEKAMRTRGRPLRMLHLHRTKSRLFLLFRSLFSQLVKPAEGISVDDDNDTESGSAGRKGRGPSILDYIDFEASEGFANGMHPLQQQGHNDGPTATTTSTYNMTMSHHYHRSHHRRSRQYNAVLSADILMGLHGGDFYASALVNPTAITVELSAPGWEETSALFDEGWFSGFGYARNVAYFRVMMHKLMTEPDKWSEGTSLRSEDGGENVGLTLSLPEMKQLFSNMVCSWLQVNSVRLTDEAVAASGGGLGGGAAGNYGETELTDFAWVVPWWCRGGPEAALRSFLTTGLARAREEEAAAAAGRGRRRRRRQHHDRRSVEQQQRNASNANAAGPLRDDGQEQPAAASPSSSSSSSAPPSSILQAVYITDALARYSHYSARAIPSPYGFTVPYCSPLHLGLAYDEATQRFAYEDRLPNARASADLSDAEPPTLFDLQQAEAVRQRQRALLVQLQSVCMRDVNVFTMARRAVLGDGADDAGSESGGSLASMVNVAKVPSTLTAGAKALMLRLSSDWVQIEGLQSILELALGGGGGGDSIGGGRRRAVDSRLARSYSRLMVLGAAQFLRLRGAEEGEDATAGVGRHHHHADGQTSSSSEGTSSSLSSSFSQCGLVTSAVTTHESVIAAMVDGGGGGGGTKAWAATSLYHSFRNSDIAKAHACLKAMVGLLLDPARVAVGVGYKDGSSRSSLSLEEANRRRCSAKRGRDWAVGNTAESSGANSSHGAASSLALQYRVSPLFIEALALLEEDDLCSRSMRGGSGGDGTTDSTLHHPNFHHPSTVAAFVIHNATARAAVAEWLVYQAQRTLFLGRAMDHRSTLIATDSGYGHVCRRH